MKECDKGCVNILCICNTRAFTCLQIMNIVENTFIIPTNAHYYKNHRMLKKFKIITLAPTCFGIIREQSCV